MESPIRCRASAWISPAKSLVFYREPVNFRFACGFDSNSEGKLQAQTSALRPCIWLCFVNAKAQRQRWLREGWDGPTLPGK